MTMPVNNELTKPETFSDFESLCHVLYKSMWSDASCSKMGRSGQGQFGIDIIGTYQQKTTGIQCKHYNKKKFSIATVVDDVTKADLANLELDHLIFATTAPSDADVTKAVSELSQKRSKAGQFTVSVDFWGDICGYISLHPDVGRAFIRDFPGSTLLTINEKASEIQATLQKNEASGSEFQAKVLASLNDQSGQVALLLAKWRVPEAKGDEADPTVVATLDFARDRLREGRTKDAREQLEKLGDPSLLRDEFSKFRYFTNLAAIEFEDGHFEAAAEGFLTGFTHAPENEKALGNRAHAFLIKGRPLEALEACNDGLVRYPISRILWALRLHARYALGQVNPEDDLPPEIAETPDLLFSRASIVRKQGDLRGAVQMLRRCLTLDGGATDAKRAFLAEALGWACDNPLRAHERHLFPEHREVLLEAIHNLEPLEQALPKIQSENTSLEVSSNVATALWLLDDKDRAFSVAAICLARHPRAEGLLRIRIKQLEADDDIPKIRLLTDQYLVDLPPMILTQLVELAANRGDVGWYDTVMQHVHVGVIDEDHFQDLRMLRMLHCMNCKFTWNPIRTTF